MAKAELKKKNLSVVIPATQDERKKALENAIAQIEKQYGVGAVMRLGQSTAMNVQAISTGSLSLDMALGIGGVPRGRIVEIYGPESSGKTTVVNIDNLLVAQPDSGEQALEIAEALVRSGGLDVIVLDSVAAMTTRAEIEGDMGDSHVGMLARLMSQAMRKLTSVIAKSNCVAIFINQVREKIGVMYGNPETTTGGRALKFYASVRMEVRKGEAIKNGAEVIGNRTKVKIVKNKVAPPFRECEFDMMYGKGISRTGEILDLAVELDIIHKSGSWFSCGDRKLGQGRDAVKELLDREVELRESVAKQVIEKRNEIVLASKKSKRAALLDAVKQDAAAAAATGVLDLDDENFDEFTPEDDD